MSVLFLFLLAGVVELGLPETLLIGAICVFVQSFWRARVRPRPVQVAFSVAEISLAITATHAVYNVPWLGVWYLPAPFRLAVAASVFFVINTLLVAAVIALTENKSLRQTWSRCYFWSFPYYLIGAAIVGMFGFANRMLDWQAWVLILPVVYVIYRSYRVYLHQLEAERRHTEEQRLHAEEVAGLHARAMESLASAMNANARLDAVIRASPLAIVALDCQGNVTSWNAMAARMFGLSLEEALHRPLPLGDRRSQDLLATVIASALSGEPLSGMEITQERKDGPAFEAAIWSAPLRDSAESICGILVTLADVSDRKRLEEQLRLSQKMEAVGRLAGGVAHDFNNLLTIINGYSAMLVDSLQHDAYASGQAEEILKAGKRAGDLVAQLLTFSRRNVVKPRALVINQLVRDIAQMLRRLIGEHIELRTVLDEEAGSLMADPSQMEAMLMNLASNARDAMPDGGILSIETARVEITSDGNPPHLNLPAGSYVKLVVADTGHGIDPETQKHLFEPFFTTKQRGKGTGLGLSSVYGGVQQNGGRIFVESEVGNGARFSIYFPRLEPAASSEAGRVVLHNPARGNESILLAEELRKRCTSLRIIYMSGHAEDIISNQGRLDPAVDLLSKPFMPDVLVRKVREALDQAHNGVMCTAPQ